MLIVMAVVLLITGTFSLCYLLLLLSSLFCLVSGLPGLMIIFSVFIVAYIIFRSGAGSGNCAFCPDTRKKYKKRAPLKKPQQFNALLWNIMVLRDGWNLT
jgi:hypothetical protein